MQANFFFPSGFQAPSEFYRTWIGKTAILNQEECGEDIDNKDPGFKGLVGLSITVFVMFRFPTRKLAML